MANMSGCDRQPEAVRGTAQLPDRWCHHTFVTSYSPTAQPACWGASGARGGMDWDVLAVCVPCIVIVYI